MNNYFFVVDIGATYTRIGLGSRDKLLDKKIFNTPIHGDEYTIAHRIYEELVKNYGEYLDEVEAIGIATIGPLDIRKGKVINTPNLPIHNFELLEPLRRLFSRPVYVLNDAVASVYGEKTFGLGRDYENIVYVTLSTGVGGGVIVDDHLLIGKMGNAHEIGHIVVNYDSEIKCGCGGFGHWEAYVGGANIPRLAEILANRYKDRETPALIEALNGKLDPPKLFQYYRRGDQFAEIVVKEIIEACIAGFSSIINIYDPELITIGGSLFLNNQDILLKPVIEGISKHLVTSKPLIRPTPLGEDVGLYGALALAINPPPKLLEIQG
ncbi:MAG: glucokinase [Desulfurococcales archaeon ex4484_58]|nr:MAG: glucokinase [Desulfurococcales archaeon ex4484_58]